MSDDLLNNVEKLHTTLLGVERVRNNLQLNEDIDVVEWCKMQVKMKEAQITRSGKNYYVALQDFIITINAHSFTIITAHKSCQ